MKMANTTRSMIDQVLVDHGLTAGMLLGVVWGVLIYIDRIVVETVTTRMVMLNIIGRESSSSNRDMLCICMGKNVEQMPRSYNEFILRQNVAVHEADFCEEFDI